MTSKFIDFEVLKESWGKYQLDDQSILKIKFILTDVKISQNLGKTNYDTSLQNIQVIYPAEHLIGKPNKSVFSNELLKNNIEKDDVSLNTLIAPANEYFLDNRTKIKIFPQVIKASRTSLKNRFGFPIYLINTNVTINFDTPPL